MIRMGRCCRAEFGGEPCAGCRTANAKAWALVAACCLVDILLALTMWYL